MAQSQDQAVMSLVLQGKNDASAALNQFNSQIRESLSVVRQFRGSLLLIGATVGAAIYSISKMVSAYEKQRIQTNQLRFALGRVGIEYDDVRNSLEGFLSSMEYLTGVSGERVQSMFIQYLRIVGDADTATQLVAGTYDLMAATGISEADAIKVVTEALKGNKDELVALGFVWDDSKTDMENLAAALELVKGKAKENQTEMTKLSARWKELTSVASDSLGPALAQVVGGLADIFGWLGAGLNWKGWDISDEDIQNAILFPFKSAWNWLKTEFSFSGLLDNFKESFAAPFEFLNWATAGVFIKIWNWSKGPLGTVWETLKDGFDTAFRGPLEWTFWGIAGVFITIWNWLKGPLGIAWGELKDVFLKWFINPAKKAIDEVIDAIQAVIDLADQLPGIHGGGIRIIPGLPKIPFPPFQYGGTVPGPVGEPVPIIAHGGETFSGPTGSMGPIIINLDGREIARYTINILSREAKLQRAW